MFHRATGAALVLAGLIALPTTSFALTGAGCPDLPEYYRALGTIENGPGSCGMTTEEANRILGRQQNAQAAPGDPAAPAPHRIHHKHHHRATTLQR